MKKSEKPVIIIGMVLALFLIAAGIFALTADSAGRHLTQQLELGQKYLEEMNYEQAIVAFEAAIAIDPKCEEAYLALAETYVAQGTGESGVYLSGEDIYVAAENVEKAMEVLEEGYSQTDSETILTRLEELRDCYHAWEAEEASVAENGAGAGDQEADDSQASNSGQTPDSQVPGSGAASQGQPAVDENDPLVQFVNAPFTDENGFGDVTSLDAAKAYADENGFRAGYSEPLPMGDLYIYKEDFEYLDPDTEEMVSESLLQVSTANSFSDINGSCTTYFYDVYENNLTYSVSTYIGNREAMTGEGVPPVGGFAGFLAEHNCLTVESILETIGLRDEELMTYLQMDHIESVFQAEIPYGTVDILIYNDVDFGGGSRCVVIEFPEDSGAPWRYMKILEVVISPEAASQHNVAKNYINITASSKEFRRG